MMSKRDVESAGEESDDAHEESQSDEEGNAEHAFFVARARTSYVFFLDWKKQHLY